MRSRLIRVVGSRRIPRSPTSVRATKLWHRRALEIRTDGHRSRVLLLYLRNRLVEIARIEVAENQPRRLRVTCDPPDDIRGRMQRAFDADADRHVQDEQVGAAGKFDKTGIGAGLVRPEHDCMISDRDAVSERRDVFHAAR